MRPTRCGVWVAAFSTLASLLSFEPGRAMAQAPPPSARPNSFAPPLAGPATSPAPTACRLTLDEFRQRALSANKALALARLNVDGKRYATSAATKDYFPKILGNVTYFHFDNPLGSVLTTRGIVLPATVAVNVLNQDTTLSTALVAQPITKLIAVNAVVNISRADEQIAQAKLDQGVKQVLSGGTQAFYGLLGGQQMLSAMQLQAKLLEQANAAHPAPELRVALVELRQGMLQVQGQIQELTDQLDDLLDFPAGTPLELVDPIPALLPVESAEQAAQMSLACNPEVREAAQNIAKAEAAIRLAKMEYLPDVNVVGGYANQTGASYIQDNITYVGVTGSYTFWDWGKRGEVLRQREADLALAHQNVEVVAGKIRLEARKSFGAYEQTAEALRLGWEMTQACKEIEKNAATPAAAISAKGATAKAELERMKAEINYRVAHAQLAAAIGCP